MERGGRNARSVAQFLNPQCAKGEGSGRLRSGAFEGSGKGAARLGGLSGDCAAAASLYLGLTQWLIAAFLSHSDAGVKRGRSSFFFF